MADNTERKQKLKMKNKTKKKNINPSKKRDKEGDNVENKSLFSLQEVISMGGDKEDFERLMQLDENEELMTNKDLDNPEDLGDLQKEIGSFLKEFGIKKTFPVEIEEQNKKDKEKIKPKIENVQDGSKHEKGEIIYEEQSLLDIPKFDIADVVSTISLEDYSKLLLKNVVPWYEMLSDIPRKTSQLSSKMLDSTFEKVEQYWNKEVEIYQKYKNSDNSTDAQWLSTVLKSGTLSDRTAALTMLTQESPIHCLRSLEALLALAKKKSRREALISIDSLRHIWISNLLPDRKLRKFNQFPIEDVKTLAVDGSKKSQLKLLMLMLFEDKLKNAYAEFLEVIKLLSKDSLANIRSKILGIIYELLVMKPEQEQVLLSMLTNKLGDPDKNIASKASYLLLQLVTKHPNMGGIVIQDVERMMFRPNVGMKAQYYACCFLNQIPLSNSLKATAAKLISLYFSFFKILVNKQSQSDEMDYQITKLLSALLTGVNRAFPFTKDATDENTDYDEQLNTLFRLSHHKHLSTSIQAFMLIYQVMESRQTVSDRFYKALYEKLLDPNLKTHSKQAMLLNLIFKAVRDDPILKRIKSFVKRLLQVSSQHQASFLCGILFLLSEVIKKKPGVKSMTSQPEDDDEEEHFTDIKEEENDDDVIENDVIENDVTNTEDTKEEKGAPTGSAWTFRSTSEDTKVYDIHTRNPLYAGGEFTCAWELVPLTNHFHPSAQHFASSVLNGEDIFYKGDPLEDFTLLRFLDRFMYRNPKKTEKDHGTSIMQKHESSSRLKEQPVNSKKFLQKTESNVRDDELFFLRFFKMKDTENSKKKKVKEEIKEEEDFELEDDFGGFDFASDMKKSKPKKKKSKDGEDEEGEEDESDSDDDDGGFDYDDMEDESEEEDFDKMGVKKNFSDKDYEEALFSQLNSDGESIDGSDDENDDEEEEETMKKPNKKKSSSDGSMFASADEFAHILEKADEDTGGYTEGIHPKQRRWEEKQNNRGKHWQKRKNDKNFKRKRSGNGKQYQRKSFSKKKKL